MSASVLMLIARIALGLCLYGFLVLLLVFLWRDLRSTRPDASRQTPCVRVHLLGLDGNFLRAYPLVKDSCLIGRSPTVEIPIADETVSAVHARFWKSGGRWWLEDLDSRNGTFLNEIAVEKSMVLCPGDRIRVGRCEMVFQAGAKNVLPASSAPSRTAPLPPGESHKQEQS